jgi:hypothetical protein
MSAHHWLFCRQKRCMTCILQCIKPWDALSPR